MGIKLDQCTTTTLSNKPLWVAMVALAIVAGSTISPGKKVPIDSPAFDDTPNGLSGHLHKAMDNVLAIQAETIGNPSLSSQGDTLIFDRALPGSPESDHTVRVFVDTEKGGLWAKYDDGRIKLLAPAVDRLTLRTDRSGGTETLVLELSAVLPTANGDGPRRNLHRIMSTTGIG